MDRMDVLLALGPGGTTELAERVLVLLERAAADWQSEFIDPYEEPDVGGLSEVAAILGKSRQAAGHWITGRHGPGGFPEPVKQLAATTLWDLNKVREWGVAVGLLEPSEVVG